MLVLMMCSSTFLLVFVIEEIRKLNNLPNIIDEAVSIKICSNEFIVMTIQIRTDFKIFLIDICDHKM